MAEMRDLRTPCPTCGAGTESGMAFCGGCGTPLRRSCPSCGSDNPQSFRFCSHCGRSLGAADASGPGPRDTAEHRLITVMFCDLVDSTALADQLGPEAYGEIVHEHHAACSEAVRRFGGHVAQYLGDGLLVYFGYPRAHEDDARRAVQTGLEILKCVEGVNARVARERGVSVAVRIGIHTGLVVAGAVGAGARREQLALGPAPNVAARLEKLAAPGTVVISGDTHALVSGFFVSEPLGPQEIRGLSAPVPAYRVVGETGVRSRFELALARGLTPSVNREGELATLLDCFERVRAGAGQAIWLVGEPGIGKSRLLQMFHERTAAGARWLLGRCAEYSQHSAMHPVIELFEQLFAIGGEDPPATRRRKLEAGVAAHGALESDALPLLGALLSVPAAGEPASLQLAPGRQRERTLDILFAILRRIAEQGPLVLAVEDLHWADPSTLEFLGRLVQAQLPRRTLVVLTHRPRFSPPFEATPGVRLELDHLSDEHVREMVEHLAGGKRLPPDVVDYIARKSDGVPIFVEELTRAVLDFGGLIERDGRVALSRPLENLAIPVTLQDLLLARLDRLGPAKDLALLASVLGREFSYEMIRAASDLEPATLERRLDDLVAGGVLYRVGDPPAVTYMFKHVLTRDAAYGLLLTSTRQHHHRRTAEAIIQRLPDVAGTRPELVAHHLTEAGMAQAAVGYWLRAGQLAVERSANVEASAHARRGLALLEQLPPSPIRDGLELQLQSTLGSAAIALQGYGAEPVQQAFGRALELCQRIDNAAQRFRAELGLWTYYVVRAEYKRAIELADHLVASARRQGAGGALVQACYCSGFSRLFVGELRASHEAFSEGGAVVCSDDDPALLLPTGDDVRIHMAAASGLVLWHLGQPSTARRRCLEAVALARRLGHPYGIAFAANIVAFFGIYSQDADLARAAAAETVALAADKGYRFFVLAGAFIEGLVLARTGKADAGIAQMRDSMHRLRAAGARMTETFLMVQLAHALFREGRRDESAALLGEAEAALWSTGERLFEPELHLVNGECRAATDPAGAERHFRAALAQARARSDCAQQLRAAACLARLCASDPERRAEAVGLLREATAAFAPDQDCADLREARTLLARQA